ncbi:MAG: hypothetical protein HQM01_08240 [Magnetococcales bacterium]|nr:hypothetical protein [Magnetococcales bacterium]
MILDNTLMFDPKGTAITTSAYSTNVIDLGAGSNLGVSHPLNVMVAIGESFAAAGNATLMFDLHAAPDNGSGAPGTWQILTNSNTINKANLMAGATFALPLPTNHPNLAGALPRFLRLQYLVGTGPFTAGKLMACLAMQVQSNPGAKSGFEVL